MQRRQLLQGLPVAFGASLILPQNDLAMAAQDTLLGPVGLTNAAAAGEVATKHA